MYEEYFEKRSVEVSINSITPTNLNNEDTPSLSSIINEDNEAPPLVSSFEEQTSLISNDVTDESIQEDSTDLDGNTLITHFVLLYLKKLRRTSKLRNDILMFQQHQGESLSEAWTRFKNLLQKVSYHGIDIWLQVQIYYDRINHTLKRTVNYAVEGRLRKISAEKAWATIEMLARYKDEGWNNPIFLEEGSLNYKNPNIEQLLRVMEC
uniref:Zinc finger, CCHC-type n=1 Tax=Tanacetum cinerariifolium TaxID=118510 RepID=A0A6L2JXC8_TANCI|nr:zinc finger, CCHC-type [Tanacetum cinerariifolium]